MQPSFDAFRIALADQEDDGRSIRGRMLTQALLPILITRPLSARASTMPYGGPGLMHFRPGLKDSFYKEVTAPKSKWVKRDGKDQLTYYTTPGIDDHAHDCIRYGDAAREFMGQNIDDICAELEKLAEERNRI